MRSTATIVTTGPRKAGGSTRHPMPASSSEIVRAGTTTDPATLHDKFFRHL